MEEIIRDREAAEARKADEARIKEEQLRIERIEKEKKEKFERELEIFRLKQEAEKKRLEDEMAAAIAQQEAAIASAAANLEDPAVSNKDEIAAAVAAMKDNIQLQKATIGYNKDVIDKNIMARAETPLTELVAQANKDAQEKIRLAEEAAAEKEKQAANTMMASAGQEGALSGSSDLNTALAELIAISKKTADLNEKQLSVQSSLSGDLFA
jgi:hypothetical protein